MLEDPCSITSGLSDWRNPSAFESCCFAGSSYGEFIVELWRAIGGFAPRDLPPYSETISSSGDETDSAGK